MREGKDVYTASLPTRNLSPVERLAFQSGSVVRVHVADVQGFNLQVSLKPVDTVSGIPSKVKNQRNTFSQINRDNNKPQSKADGSSNSNVPGKLRPCYIEMFFPENVLDYGMLDASITSSLNLSPLRLNAFQPCC